MTRRRVSNPLALAVLSLLLERPMHPYEMSSTLRERGKEMSIKLNYGSLYSVIDQLVRHGLIEVQETVREGRRPERTVYTVTETGRAEFHDWLCELLSVPVKEYTSFEAGLSLLPGLPPDDALAALEQRVGRLAMELRAMESMRELGVERGLPRLFWIESEFWHTIRQAELDYTQRLAAEIAQGSLEGVDMWRRWYASGELEAPPQAEQWEGGPNLRRVT
jgi:DNA-binding PadR family transcriptional regulator